MKIKDEEKIAQRKADIMQCAKEILAKEGIEGLSIRKISDALSQTPGIIYHYFENKDELLREIVKEGYGTIVTLLTTSFDPSMSCDKQLRTTLSAYLHGMLKEAQVFSMLMNSHDPIIRQQTDILQEGICTHRRSMQMLKTCLDHGKAQGIFQFEDGELRAQCIWCSVYGLLDRILKEQPPVALQERLIKELLDMILASLGGNV